MFWRLIAQQIPLNFVGTLPIMEIVYTFIILFCLPLKWHLGSTAFIMSRQNWEGWATWQKGREEGTETKPGGFTWRDRALSTSRSWYSMHWLTPSSVPLKSDSDPPEQKLLLEARCLCNAKKGNLRMWFSPEGLWYSKMLLFLLSLPFIYSEPGLLIWVTRSYFCLFSPTVFTNQMYNKRTEYLCFQKQAAWFTILELPCKNYFWSCQLLLSTH